MSFPRQQVEPIGPNDPLGKNDVHTILGAMWRHYGVMSPCMIWMMRSTFGWKIEPIQDEE